MAKHNSLSINRYPVFFILVGMFLVVMASCATPIPPTGGPADKQGPKVKYTVPESGTTNFDGRSFEFHFDEYVQRSSVSQAITVEPDLGIEYDVSWKKMRMTITFNQKFPDSTTVLIKLGTDISDTRGNKMTRPVTLAISTGDVIDSGKINGRILDAKTGNGAEGFTVFLYRQPWNLEQKANYTVRTDTGGYFNFSYLAEGNYKPMVVDDRNRNKTWEPSSEIAFPFFREQVRLDAEGQDTLDVLYVTRKDTIAPKLQGVGLFSTNRMRLRFSENMKLQDETNIHILDSLKTPYTEGYPLYILPNEKFVVFAQSPEPLEENKEYYVWLEGFTDEAGNKVDTTLFSFMGSSQEDTTKQRIINTNTEEDLRQNESFNVTYAAPITNPEISDSLVVIEGSVDFDDWPEIETVQNKLIIKPQERWIEGLDYQFLIWNPVTHRRAMFEPEIWDSTEYGEIELNLNEVDSASVYRVEVLNNQNNSIRNIEFRASTTISELPPVSYKLIIFEDENNNGTWDQGSIMPYQRPEKYHIQRGVKVQQGFTSEVSISF